MELLKSLLQMQVKENESITQTSQQPTISTDDVHTRLEKAAEMDEIDTVTFGAETEDGKIVKIYVKVEDGDKFEQALSEMLGKIDDIEEALEELSKEFEIVDVEWPDEEEKENKENADELKTDGSESLNGNIDYDKDGLEFDEYGQYGKEKPTMESLGNKFKSKILNEEFSVIDSVNDSLTTSLQKTIFDVIMKLGLPEEIIKLNKAKFISGIREVSKSIVANSSQKNTLELLAKTMGIKTDKVKDKEEISESEKSHDMIDAHLTNSLQVLLKDIMIALGVPEDLIEKKRTVFLIAIKNKAIDLIDRQRERFLLKLLARKMNIIYEAEEIPVSSNENAITMVGTDPYRKLALDIANSIGVPEELLLRRPGTIREMGIAVRSIDPQILAHLKKAFGFKSVEGIDDRMTEAEMSSDEAIDSEVDVKDEKPKKSGLYSGEDVGKWNVSKVNGTLLMTAENYKLEFDADETENLIMGMADKKVIRMKDESGLVSFIFSPRGNDYVLKMTKSGKEIKIPHQTVIDIMD